MIQVRGLRKAFGSNVAVDDISFEIRKGELFGLLGPNGAGKSTTINLMVGALPLDAGDIRIDGSSDPTRAVVRRKIGLAPQALALYEELSAEENLAFYGRLYGLRGASLREHVTWCLELAGLTDRRFHLIKTFSGGMKRRINLACALVHTPQVLFLDEPTVGVDPQSRSQVFESLETLHRSGLTILYTTHYMEEAQRLCDRVRNPLDIPLRASPCTIQGEKPAARREFLLEQVRVPMLARKQLRESRRPAVDGLPAPHPLFGTKAAYAESSPSHR
jgi:ABC-2 type transport system ATP-binding protein